MLARMVLQCAVSLVFVAACPVFADALNVKTGAWEMTTTTLITGMPMPAEALAKMTPEQRTRMEAMIATRAGKPSKHVSKSCVTKEDLDQDSMIKSDNVDCKKEVISRSTTKIVVTETCEAPNASTSNVIIEAKTPENVVANMDMTQPGASGKIQVNIDGRWLDASCAGIGE
jgi:hypothetical protein